ncbi:hypothetical protein [Ferruginibacter albus]|uniref:hypothetical protein n=1 Tax=Ferruginibacter albus TaxID=2875540 RepID=UPI001CC803C1|nr:hypothetical protein [Ferruginibacter albus]UAY52304.1 hypothetical protein K9M53_01095 [Ferruginibacter albus]
MFKFLSFIVIVLLFIQPVKAQHIDSLLNQLTAQYQQEKIYVQYDKGYYFSGDTIWFKAYITTVNLAPALSKTIYAELLDDKGKLLQRKVMPVIQSGAASAFELPDSLKSSTLYVRAYTQWMLNFDSSLLYIKPISIINTSQAPKKPIASLYTLSFFPEGGDLVAGIASKVAFKAVDQKGMPVAVSGNIVDEKNSKVTAFSSVHDGMGYFTLDPLAGKLYKAQWKDKKGTLHETALPTIKEQGATLALTYENNRVNYSISRTDGVDESFKKFSVIAHIQHQLVYSAKINMAAKNVVNAYIPADSTIDGIMQVTLFNADDVPVAERIVFVSQGNYFFNTDLHAIEKNIIKRGHNVLQIDVGGTLNTNLSIAVTDGDLNPVSGNEDNIYSSLLLSQDVKGYVYNPAYYFSSDDDSVKQHLDLVMMTNGWRRFKWEELLVGKWPQLKYSIDSQISIQGKAFGLTSIALKGKELTGILKTKNTSTNMFIMPLDKAGQFKQSNMYFFDTAKLFYQFNNDKDKIFTSTASFSFSNGFAKPPFSSLQQLNDLFINPIDSSLWKKNKLIADLIHKEFLENEKKIKLLTTVTVTAKIKSKEEKMNEEYTSGFFSSDDAHTFILEDDISSSSYSSIINYLQGKVAGLQIYTDGSGNASASWRGGTPGFYLDEMSSDMSAMQSIPVADIAMIKVFPPPFYGGSGDGSGGAIAIYTKKGSSRNPDIKGLDFVSIVGYSPIKEFYSPNYETTTDFSAPDYRTTLYWNPYLIMNAKRRRITIPFYNNDQCKKIRVIIEGVNENGQLTHEEKIFQ